MNRDITIEYPTMLQHFTLTNVDDSSQDITILNHMARATFCVADQLHKRSSSFPLPSIYVRETPGGHVHRIVTNTHVPISKVTLPFVGFISKKQAQIPAEVQKNITHIDEAMVSGLAKYPTLLSYASLQLTDQNWYNLVLFSQASAKQDMLSVQLHQYAAYELAPRYYQWIRLHHGVITRDDTVIAITLYLTKYYTFHMAATRPEVHVDVYQPSQAIPEIVAR